MPLVREEDTVLEGLLEVARLLLLDAKTAPKSLGRDDVDMVLVWGAEKDKIAEEMERIAREKQDPYYLRDAESVRKAQAMILMGTKGKVEGDVLKIVDLGIAVGSLVKLASTFGIDTRIMYRAGVAAKRIGILRESEIVLGVPLAVYSKSPFFDRQVPKLN